MHECVFVLCTNKTVFQDRMLPSQQRGVKHLCRFTVTLPHIPTQFLLHQHTHAHAHTHSMGGKTNCNGPVLLQGLVSGRGLGRVITVKDCVCVFREVNEYTMGGTQNGLVLEKWMRLWVEWNILSHIQSFTRWLGVGKLVLLSNEEETDEWIQNAEYVPGVQTTALIPLHFFIILTVSLT